MKHPTTPGTHGTKKQIRRRGGLAFVLALLLIGTAGCEALQEHTLTGKLWSGEDHRRFSDPAPNPRAQLSESKTRRDILVEYDALTGPDDRVERRAYFLNQNRSRLEQHRKPVFLRRSDMRELDLVFIPEGPLGSNGTNSLSYAITGEGRGFYLFAPQQLSREWELPVYPEASGRWKTIALTPLTFAGDCTIVGAVLGMLFWQGWAGFVR